MASDQVQIPQKLPPIFSILLLFFFLFGASAFRRKKVRKGKKGRFRQILQFLSSLSDVIRCGSMNYNFAMTEFARSPKMKIDRICKIFGAF